MIPCKNHPERPAVPRKNGKGTMGVCRECIQARHFRRKKTGRTAAADPPSVHLDFSEHPEILSKIREKAKENFRTVENEILFMLRTV